MWAYSSQNRENWYISYKFVQKGYIPLSDFYQICQISHCGFKNVVLQPQQSRKMVIFGINLPISENSGVPQKKLNIGAQSSMQWHRNCFENYTAS